MDILNTIPDFLKIYRDNSELKITDLESYYALYPNIFEFYFLNHCPKTSERLTEAIAKYPQKLKEIEITNEILPHVIKKVVSDYDRKYDIKIDSKFNLFVGGFGSNAFIDHKIVADVYMAAEKLSPKDEHLRVMVSHELGHVYHNIRSDQKGLEWKKVEWTSPFIALYREGVATFCSQQIAVGLSEDVYYSYDDKGTNWLAFYKENRREIKKRFLRDATGTWSMDKEKEWFRLSGGKYFGFNRLGYFIGTEYVHHLVHEFGEKKAITYWCSNDIHKSATEWLHNS